MLLHARPAGSRPTRRSSTDLAGAAQGLGHRDRQRRRRSTSAAWAGCSAPTRRCRSRRAIQPHPITEHFNLLTAYPLARSVTPIERRHQRPHRAAPRRDEPEQLGGNRPQEADQRSARSKRGPDKGDKQGPVSLAAAVSAPATDAPRPRRSGRSRGRQPEHEAGNAHRRRSATRISRATATLGDPGQPRSVPQHDQLARAAGEPDLDPAARPGGSAHHADGRPASGGSSA